MMVLGDVCHMSLTWGQRVAITGGIALVVGAPMDWLVAQGAASGLSQSGLEYDDGYVTLVVGVLTAGLVWYGASSDDSGWGWRPRTHAVVTLAGLVALVVVASVAGDIEDANQVGGAGASVVAGAGASLTALAGLLLLLTGVVSVGRFYAGGSAGGQSAPPDATDDGDAGTTAAAGGGEEDGKAAADVEGGDAGDDGAAADVPDGASADVADRLRELRDLRDEGVITDEEFERKKQTLLDEL